MCNTISSYFAILSLFYWNIAYGQDAKTVASERFEHVTVLASMPADHMGKVMNIMSEALGVNCTHCHDGFNFAKEGVETKTTARKMIEMTIALNKEQFGGRSVVTCITCHQGRAKPVDASISATQIAIVTSTNTDIPVPIQGSVATSRDVRRRSVQDILKRYQQGIRIESESVAFVSQKFNAKRKEPDGKQENEIITLADPASWEQVTYYDQLAVTERFNKGVIEKWVGDKRMELKPDEVSHIKIEAALALGLGLDSLFSNWMSADPVRIADRPMQVLRASDEELTHHFYFDDETGLLRRRTATLPTVLGAYVIEVDYNDYQSINAIKRPLRTSFKMPSVTWEQLIQR